MSRYLTELAAVARRTGYPVREVDGWRTRGHGRMVDKPQGVIAHHTASGSRSGDAPSLRIVRSGRSDLRGPLAQFVLGRDGTIHVVAAGLAYHAGATRQRWQGNYYSVGIEAENNGVGEKWTDRQKAAYVALAAELLDEWRLPASRFVGHKEICSPRGRKIDPANLSMDGMRSRVAKYARPKPPPARPAPPAKQDPDGPLTVRAATLAGGTKKVRAYRTGPGERRGTVKRGKSAQFRDIPWGDVEATRTSGSWAFDLKVRVRGLLWLRVDSDPHRWVPARSFNLR